jgi:hypothetical protein
MIVDLSAATTDCRLPQDGHHNKIWIWIFYNLLEYILQKRKILLYERYFLLFMEKFKFLDIAEAS